MFVKQLSVFVENKQGKIADFTRILAEEQLDLIALSVADTTNFGILRAIVSDSDRALSCVMAAGYAVSLTDVLAVAVPDQPGGLHAVLEMLNNAQISLEYLYSFVRNVQENAVIIFRVSEPEKAVELFKANNIRLLSQEEIASA